MFIMKLERFRFRTLDIPDMSTATMFHPMYTVDDLDHMISEIVSKGSSKNRSTNRNGQTAPGVRHGTARMILLSARAVIFEA